VLGGVAFLAMMLRPFLRHISKESRRCAELLVQLPPELDVEGMVAATWSVVKQVGLACGVARPCMVQRGTACGVRLAACDVRRAHAAHSRASATTSLHCVRTCVRTCMRACTRAHAPPQERLLVERSGRTFIDGMGMKSLRAGLSMLSRSFLGTTQQQQDLAGYGGGRCGACLARCWAHAARACMRHVQQRLAWWPCPCVQAVHLCMCAPVCRFGGLPDDSQGPLFTPRYGGSHAGGLTPRRQPPARGSGPGGAAGGWPADAPDDLLPDGGVYGRGGGADSHTLRQRRQAGAPGLAGPGARSSPRGAGVSRRAVVPVDDDML
jgi:hypothetical protein